MESLFFIIPIAIGTFVLAGGFFFWAVKTGQYDDLEGPAHKILMNDEEIIEDK